MNGVTFDTGALIALERGKGEMSRRVRRMRESGIPITVPAVVLIEWWRSGFGKRHSEILAPMHVEPIGGRIARSAGEALTQIPASVVDAAVMASAALRGDVVFTSDLGDLGRLQTHFPTVRLFGV